MVKTRKLRALACKAGTKPRKLGTANETCYTEPVLREMVSIWNSIHPTQRILTQKTGNAYVKYVLKQLSTKLKDCEDELCWLEHIVQDTKQMSDIERKVFAPKPDDWHKGLTSWLSNDDLDAVGYQFEDIHPTFKFIKTTPKDFDTVRYEDDYTREYVSNDLTQLPLQEYKTDGYESFGVFINMDKHDESGSHWVTLFVSMKHKLIVYFDSYGMHPPNTIRRLIGNIKKKAQQEFGEKYESMIITKRHQFGDSECGMFGIYFLSRMISSKSPRSVVKRFQCGTRFLDTKIREKRKKYFRVNERTQKKNR